MIKSTLLLLFFTYNAFCSNYSLLNDYLNKKVTDNKLILNFDTTQSGMNKLLKEVDENVSTEMVFKGPFFHAFDSIFNKYVKGEDQFEFIIDKISMVTDGWISDNFSILLKKYIDKNNSKWVEIILKQGKESKLLSMYLYSSQKPYDKLPLFNNLSKNQSKLLEYLDYQIKNYTFE